MIRLSDHLQICTKEKSHAAHRTESTDKAKTSKDELSGGSEAFPSFGTKYFLDVHYAMSPINKRTIRYVTGSFVKRKQAVKA